MSLALYLAELRARSLFFYYACFELDLNVFCAFELVEILIFPMAKRKIIIFSATMLFSMFVGTSVRVLK
jgi:hypothetical protein